MISGNAKRRFRLLRAGILVLTLAFLLSGCSTLFSQKETSSYEMSSASSSKSQAVDSESEPAPSSEPESFAVSSDTDSSEDPGNEDDPVTDPSEDPAASESSADEGLLPPADTENDAFNEKFMQNAIDAAYEEEIAVAISVSDMVEICNKYANLWNEEVDNAYMHLLAAAEEDQYPTYKSEQEEWISEKDGKIAEISEAAMAQGGSMAFLNGASQIMNFYRDRAMVLYEELYQYDPEFSFQFQANG